jgi:AraC family transcriptional regulator
MTEPIRSQEFYGEDRRHRRVAAAQLVEKCHAPDERLPRHRHSFPYLSFVVAGGYWERSGVETTACGPGVLVVHPGGEAHEDHFGARASRLLVVEPTPEALPPEASRAFERRAVLEGPHVRRLMGSLLDELAQDDDLSDLAVQGALLELAVLVLRSPAAAGPAGEAPAWLREAARIVAERCCEPIALSDVAREVGVHASHLAREVRRHYGSSVGELVRRARIQHALRRIHAVGSLAELAMECGFADQSHFTRCFRRLVGVTPGRYRAGGNRLPR